MHKHSQNHFIVLSEVLKKKVLGFPTMLMHLAALSGWWLAVITVYSDN